MTKRAILIHPDPRLKKVCAPVTAFDDKLKALADDMLETMYEAPGIGLAAPQIGVDARLLVMDCAQRDGDGEGNEAEPARPMVLVNPQVMWSSEETNVYEEGCLSIPEEFAEVTRPSSVTVAWTDLDGGAAEETFEGIWATCVQHEIDHLNGKLFIDYLSSLKRQMITGRMKKLKRQRATG